MINEFLALNKTLISSAIMLKEGYERQNEKIWVRIWGCKDRRREDKGSESGQSGCNLELTAAACLE